MLTLALQAYTMIQYRRLWRNMPRLEPRRCFGKGLYLRVLAFNVCQLFLVACVPPHPLLRLRARTPADRSRTFAG